VRPWPRRVAIKRAWWAQSPAATIWETTLERSVTAPALARRELASHLDGELGGDRTSDLLLLAGELVTNNLVERPSDRWGMERDGTWQTRVWFEMLRHPPAGGRTPSW
jgi:hypothetical protein